MAERAASSTAVLVCQGRAAADGRYAVGRFSDAIAQDLLDPSELMIVDAVRAEQVPTRARDRVAYEMVRRVAVTMVPRTIAIDDAIRDRGAEQLVILGAGLDARAWRMPELAGVTVFEVDHPASLLDKQRRIGRRAPTAEKLVSVSVDLARQRLGPTLEAAGFDRRIGTTWVWEGVVPYLTARQVQATVAQLGELSAPGSRLIVNYQGKSLPVTVMRAVMRLVLRVSRQPDPMAGEPWRSLWRPETMRKMLSHNGFDTFWDKTLLGLAAGLALPWDNNGSLANGRVALAVRR
ncbi:MAG TPA: class I SAM-dependent methyltransferase [Pedococcus sp.]|jgi:methyltransferase (TIGR00027 family)|nr:class I SAM-dependent methyltransferase [Pedococcus sp.]